MTETKKTRTAQIGRSNDVEQYCLKDTPLFANLSQQEIAHFNNMVYTKLYKKNHILYHQEDAAQFFYIIWSGWIKLFKTMPEGEEVIVDIITRGHMFGESAIFSQDHHTCTAQVVEDSRVLIIPSNILREQILVNPRLAVNLLASLSRHHRRHYGELALNAMLSAPQRIGYFLLRLCPNQLAESVTFHLPYDKMLIADTLGMKGATFSRALNILRQKTNIKINDTRVDIDSVELLTAFVHGGSAKRRAMEQT